LFESKNPHAYLAKPERQARTSEACSDHDHVIPRARRFHR
jgi:hypothetical protein